jgi:hypothetical protein
MKQKRSAMYSPGMIPPELRKCIIQSLGLDGKIAEDMRYKYAILQSITDKKAERGEEWT